MNYLRGSSRGYSLCSIETELTSLAVFHGGRARVFSQKAKMFIVS